MKKTLAVAALVGSILAGGSFALASTTTTQSHGVSFNSIAFTQSDWGTVSGHGYTALAECPAGQQYIDAYVVSEGTYSTSYEVPDVSAMYVAAHTNSNGDVDGVYLTSGVGSGGQGSGTVELVCAG